MDRHLPFIHRISIYNRTSIQIGLISLVLGVWLCSAMINVEELLIESQLEGTNTTIAGITMNRWEADWDDDGKVTSYGYDYYFFHPELGQISNTSFSNVKKGNVKGGDTVQIYYDESYPYINKIVAMRYAERSSGVLWLLIIPLVAIVFLSYGINTVKGIKRLLKKGIFTWGDFVKHEKTVVKTNETQEYRMYYKYKTTDDTYHTQSFTTLNPSDFDRNEILVYDQNHPERMILLYKLPYIVAKYIEGNWDVVKSL